MTLSSSRQLASEICCTLKSSLQIRRPRRCKGGTCSFYFPDIPLHSHGKIFTFNFRFSSLRRGPTSNTQDSSGYSALHHAALNGHLWVNLSFKEILIITLLLLKISCMKSHENTNLKIILPETLSASCFFTMLIPTYWTVVAHPHYTWLHGLVTSRSAGYFWNPQTQQLAAPMLTLLHRNGKPPFTLLPNSDTWKWLPHC